MCGLKSSIPSSFLRTRSIAPEQPPQDMETLNLYLCSAMVCVCVCGGREGEKEYARGSRGRCSVDVGGDGLE